MIKRIKQFSINFYIRLIKFCLPVNDKLIIFKSTPDFSDNSRALAEYLIQNGYSKQYKICFIVKDVSLWLRYQDLPIYFFSLEDRRLKRLKNLKYLYTAKYLMSTHEMILPIEEKREEQLLIRLWHGCGYKDRSKSDNVQTRRFDIALVPGEVFIKTKSYFWNVDKKYILAKGYPRYDWLLNKDNNVESLLKSILAKDSKKKIIWMPTFRKDKTGRHNDTNHITNFPIVYTSQDWERLDSICCDKKISLLIKLHPYQANYDIPFNTLNNIKSLTNEFLEENDIPLYKIIALSNALISDYSSVAIDYLLVDNPLAFTLDDYDIYKESRGFVFDNPLEYMPGHHLYDMSDLISFIEDVAESKDPYKHNRDKIREVAIANSCHYCLDILNTLNITN